MIDRWSELRDGTLQVPSIVQCDKAAGNAEKYLSWVALGQDNIVGPFVSRGWSVAIEFEIINRAISSPTPDVRDKFIAGDGSVI